MVLVSHERWKQLLDTEKKCSNELLEKSDESINNKDTYDLIPPGIPENYTPEFTQNNNRKKKSVKLNWKTLPKAKK